MNGITFDTVIAIENYRKTIIRGETQISVNKEKCITRIF